MAEQIVHPGKVTAVTPQMLTVGFTASAACGSCRAAGLCSMAERKEKTVEVPNIYGSRYQVGDEVEVAFRSTMGMKAVWLCYAIPAVILLGIVLGAMKTGLNELWSGLAGIGGVALWYFGLWLLRGKLNTQHIFTLK